MPRSLSPLSPSDYRSISREFISAFRQQGSGNLAPCILRRGVNLWHLSSPDAIAPLSFGDQSGFSYPISHHAQLKVRLGEGPKVVCFTSVAIAAVASKLRLSEEPNVLPPATLPAVAHTNII